VRRPDYYNGDTAVYLYPPEPSPWDDCFVVSWMEGDEWCMGWYDKSPTHVAVDAGYCGA
jgi:hypothetical protein